MKIIKKILNVILVAAALLTLTNYTVYLCHLVVFPEQPVAFVITICVLAGVILPFLLRRRLKRVCGKVYPVLKGIWGACLVFYAVSFVVMSAGILSQSAAENADVPRDSVVVVFGAKVNGTEDNAYPGLFLKYRLDAAAGILKKDPGSVCIVCGGKGDNEPRAEADVMKDYLVGSGIEPDRIFCDRESTNTIENIDAAKRIISENGLAARPVACLSTNFHIPRIKYLCGRADFAADCYISAASPNFFGLWSSLVREYMSYGKLILTGHL